MKRIRSTETCWEKPTLLARQFNMNDPKPCIIRESVSKTGYFAYDEHARFICSWATYDSCVRYAASQGYETVPLNSRFGRTILDKLNNERV
jgi:hypothetical protein